MRGDHAYVACLEQYLKEYALGRIFVSISCYERPCAVQLVGWSGNSVRDHRGPRYIQAYVRQVELNVTERGKACAATIAIDRLQPASGDCMPPQSDWLRLYLEDNGGLHLETGTGITYDYKYYHLIEGADLLRAFQWRIIPRLPSSAEDLASEEGMGR